MIRFTFTYDQEYDKDIHELLQRTPEKHRSEELRKLIRYGLMMQNIIKTPGLAATLLTQTQPVSSNDESKKTKDVPDPDNT